MHHRVPRKEPLRIIELIVTVCILRTKCHQELMNPNRMKKMHIYVNIVIARCSQDRIVPTRQCFLCSHVVSVQVWGSCCATAEYPAARAPNSASFFSKRETNMPTNSWVPSPSDSDLRTVVVYDPGNSQSQT